MRVQRAIRVILSTVLMVTLCFCMIGCQPSEEEIKKKELENAKNKKIEWITSLENEYIQQLKEYKTLLDLGDEQNSYITNAMTNDYLAWAVNRSKELISECNSIAELEKLEGYFSSLFRYSILSILALYRVTFSSI